VPRFFADKQVDFSKLPSFRVEHFPYSGPYPWLDQRDALERVAARLDSVEITPEQARQCRHWAEHGYVILDRLIEEPVLDEVWSRYEDAVRLGKIKLPSERAADGDRYPGRYLNPHKK
jgi:hypothetical protein